MPRPSLHWPRSASFICSMTCARSCLSRRPSSRRFLQVRHPTRATCRRRRLGTDGCRQSHRPGPAGMGTRNRRNRRSGRGDGTKTGNRRTRRCGGTHLRQGPGNRGHWNPGRGTPGKEKSHNLLSSRCAQGGASRGPAAGRQYDPFCTGRHRRDLGARVVSASSTNSPPRVGGSAPRAPVGLPPGPLARPTRLQGCVVGRDSGG